MLQGFLLGLSTGTTCLAYCSPVLIPYLLGEGKAVRQTALTVSQFMLGRLAGYLLFAVAAWLANRFLTGFTAQRDLCIGSAYILLATLLLRYGLATPTSPCAGRSFGIRRLTGQKAPLMPLLLGLVTGLNLCPPFLLAFAAAVDTPSIGSSLLFFLAFFLGTSLYFLPLPLLGTLQNLSQPKIVGRLAAVGMSIYYIYCGLLMILGGMVHYG